MKEILSNSKVYVNAKHQSIGLQYFTFIVLLAIVPLGVLLLYYKALKVVDFQILHPMVLLITFTEGFAFAIIWVGNHPYLFINTKR